MRFFRALRDDSSRDTRYELFALENHDCDEIISLGRHEPYLLRVPVLVKGASKCTYVIESIGSGDFKETIIFLTEEFVCLLHCFLSSECIFWMKCGQR